MAGVAFRRRILVLAVHVALRAIQADVCTGQRKLCLTVIEG